MTEPRPMAPRARNSRRRSSSRCSTRVIVPSGSRGGRRSRSGISFIDDRGGSAYPAVDRPPSSSWSRSTRRLRWISSLALRSSASPLPTWRATSVPSVQSVASAASEASVPSVTVEPLGRGAASARGTGRAVGAGSLSADWMVFWTSSCAFRNSRMPRPMDRPTSGSRRGPTTSSAMTRMTMSSRGPMLNISSVGSRPRRFYCARFGMGRARLPRLPGRKMRGPRRRPLPLRRDVLGDGLHLVLEPAEGPAEQEHVANQPHEHDGDGQGAHDADDDPDGGGGGHADDASRAVGSALTGQELLDAPVVLQGEVEVDEVVDGERWAFGELASGVDPLLDLAPARDVRGCRDQEGHDLAVRSLLHAVEAGGAGEPVGALPPAM